MKKVLSLFVLLAAINLTIVAQQEAMFTHYMFNTLEINPAYAGSRQTMSFVGLHRSQWAGFEGAPLTQTISMNTPLYGDEFAAGLSYNGDRIGPIKSNVFNIMGAYRLKVNENVKLSFGLNGGFHSLISTFDQLTLTSATDETFINNNRSRVTPNFGFGTYCYSEKWYAGLSSPRIIENSYYVKGSRDLKILQNKRHYYFIVGGLYSLNDQIQLKPSALVKSVPGAPVQLDLTLQAIYNDLFWLGITTRSGDALGMMMGFNINNNLQLGYSYDFSYSWRKYSSRSGSHEVVLRYDLHYGSPLKVKSPRYF
jgi:type IX secretion system PorP/SprF family membrane protein